MNKMRISLLATIVAFAPTLAQATPPAGSPSGNPPPHPTCTYNQHTCLVSAPDLNFVVSEINGITPASSNDCKLLPPCSGHRPPPPPSGDNGPGSPD